MSKCVKTKCEKRVAPIIGDSQSNPMDDRHSEFLELCSGNVSIFEYSTKMEMDAIPSTAIMKRKVELFALMDSRQN